MPQQFTYNCWLRIAHIFVYSYMYLLCTPNSTSQNTPCPTNMATMDHNTQPQPSLTLSQPPDSWLHTPIAHYSHIFQYIYTDFLTLFDLQSKHSVCAIWRYQALIDHGLQVWFRLCLFVFCSPYLSVCSSPDLLPALYFLSGLHVGFVCWIIIKNTNLHLYRSQNSFLAAILWNINLVVF